MTRNILVFEATAVTGNKVVGFEVTRIENISLVFESGKKMARSAVLGDDTMGDKTFVADVSGAKPSVTQDGKEAGSETASYVIGVSPFVDDSGGQALPSALSQLQKAYRAKTPPEPFTLRFTGAHTDTKMAPGFREYVRFETHAPSRPAIGETGPCTWTFRVADGRITSMTCVGKFGPAQKSGSGDWTSQLLWDYGTS